MSIWRALICEELKITCTVQMRRFDTLVPALNENRGEAVIASIAVTAETRKVVDFTDPYYRVPARFVARRKVATAEPASPSSSRARRSPWSPAPRMKPISGRCSPKPQPVAYLTADATREALRRGEVDYVFGDGIALSFWINGTDSERLLRLSPAGRSSRASISARASASRCASGNDTLRLALNWALFRLWEKGRFTDLWLRYFPVNPF